MAPRRRVRGDPRAARRRAEWPEARWRGPPQQIAGRAGRPSDSRRCRGAAAALDVVGDAWIGRWRSTSSVLDHGYPRFAQATFLDGDWNPWPDRVDTIPRRRTGWPSCPISSTTRCAPAAIRVPEHACSMATTWSRRRSLRLGKYPGSRARPASAIDSSAGRLGFARGSPHEIEPDKAGIAGYALMRLYDAAGGRTLAQALHNARVLAANQQPGASALPWPFRADYRDGAGRGAVSGNMSYILRLYDELIAHGTASSVRRAQRSGAGSNSSRFPAPRAPAACSPVLRGP